jgi:hypothetical protein
MQWLLDWLFRFGLYHGVTVQCPRDLILVRLANDGQMVQRYVAHINEDHEMAEWLDKECQGPWSINMKKRHETTLSFARLADAMIFKFMVSD